MAIARKHIDDTIDILYKRLALSRLYNIIADEKVKRIKVEYEIDANIIADGVKFYRYRMVLWQ